MTKTKPPAEIMPPERHDPYKMRSLEQILALFDGGDFLATVMADHKELMTDLIDHKAEHGTKGCKGSMSIQINYDLGKSGDAAMTAKATFTGPKGPPSSAAAFITDQGDLTLYSPLMARMHQPVRDVGEYDPETGEVRDTD